MGTQARIGTDGGTSEADADDAILGVLPPEKLLKTGDISRIRGGIACIHSIETVREYVGYENTHEQRTPVLRLLHQRATELREQM